MNSKISAFDLDHTLARSNTSFQFGIFLYRMRLFSFPTMLSLVGYYCAHKAGLISLQSLHVNIFQRLFKGRSEKNIRLLADLFYQETHQAIWNPSILERLKNAQNEGHFTVILSSSPDFLVRPFAEKLGVDRWCATPYHSNSEQRFSHLGRIFCGQEKAAHLTLLMTELGVSGDSTYAYTDSVLDLPFLNAVGNPIAVNPDRKLKRICREKNWPVITTS